MKILLDDSHFLLSLQVCKRIVETRKYKEKKNKRREILWPVFDHGLQITSGDMIKAMFTVKYEVKKKIEWVRNVLLAI